MVTRARHLIRQMIGRVRQRFQMTWASDPRRARDWSERDYRFWDRARRCKERGLELSGLFLKPLASKKAAWVLGPEPRWTHDSSRGQEVLADWWTRNHALVLRTYEESVALGQAYLVVNPDGSLTALPPHVVSPIVDDDDYSQIIGWRVTEVHPHPARPNDQMTITDEYTATRRVRTVARNGTPVRTEEYPNLTGLVPVIPLPNGATLNEVFGTPEGAAALPLLHKYGEALDAALTGNKHQGRPTPTATFDSVDQMNAFWDWAEQSGFITRQTTTHEDGTKEEHYELQFDSDKFLMLAGGKFAYEQPGSFAGDTEKLLGLLFYLWLQHTEIPEFIWGNAIASSKASAEAQMPPFIKWIEKQRGEVAAWMLALSKVVLATYGLWERGITDAEPVLAWEPLTNADDMLTVEAVRWAYVEGLLTEETALRMLPLDIQDPAAELEAARAERDSRRPAPFEPDTPPEEMNVPEFRARELALEKERAAA